MKTQCPSRSGLNRSIAASSPARSPPRRSAAWTGKPFLRASRSAADVSRTTRRTGCPSDPPRPPRSRCLEGTRRAEPCASPPPRSRGGRRTKNEARHERRARRRRFASDVREPSAIPREHGFAVAAGDASSLEVLRGRPQLQVYHAVAREVHHRLCGDARDARVVRAQRVDRAEQLEALAQRARPAARRPAWTRARASPGAMPGWWEGRAPAGRSSDCANSNIVRSRTHR